MIRRSTHYGITFVTQVAVFNVAAALTVDFGLAISTLIAVTDIAATSSMSREAGTRSMPVRGIYLSIFETPINAMIYR